MACSTCDGWTLPDEQAEPEDTATPARSKPITAVSAFRPGTVNSVVFGSRGTLGSEHDDAGGLPQAAFEPVPQGFDANGVISKRGHGGLCGSAKAGNPGNVLGSCPAAPFLTAAAQQRLKSRQPLGQNHGADPLGAADLVRRKRHQIGTYHIDIKRYFSERLDRIDMQQSAGGMDDLSHLGDRLHGAGFVVG